MLYTFYKIDLKSLRLFYSFFLSNVKIRKVHPNCPDFQFQDPNSRWWNRAEKRGEDPGRNGVEFAMRVPAPNRSDRAESGSGEMPENGRSRRKRVPKTCDCCGPNGKPHAPGHEQISKKRGRKKKDMVSQEEVAAEEVVSTSGVVTLDPVDAGTVSEMEEAPSPRGKPDFSHTERASESTLMVNGSENSDHTLPSDSKELSGSQTLNDLMKKPWDSSLSSAEPDVPAHTDAMDTEPSSCCAHVKQASWDHHYCRAPGGESRSDGTGQEPPPAEFTTEGIIECIHGSVRRVTTLIWCHFLLLNMLFFPPRIP